MELYDEHSDSTDMSRKFVLPNPHGCLNALSNAPKNQNIGNF